MFGLEGEMIVVDCRNSSNSYRFQAIEVVLYLMMSVEQKQIYVNSLHQFKIKTSTIIIKVYTHRLTEIRSEVDIDIIRRSNR